jgi:hypothetical protein
MARLPVSFLVGSLGLVGALLAVPAPLEAQATGVLRATVRVADYQPSLAALETARIALTSPSRVPLSVLITQGYGTRVHVLAKARRDPADPVVVTISYLN